MMAVVEVSWEESDGTTHGTIRAKMEDTSRSGARIRVNTAIGVGTTVWVKRPWEEIAGITKYCRREGLDYVLGIQRILEWRERKAARSAGGTHEKLEDKADRITDQQMASMPKEVQAQIGNGKKISDAMSLPQTKAVPNTRGTASAPKPKAPQKMPPLPKLNLPATPVSARTNRVKSHEKPQAPLISSGIAQPTQSLSPDTGRRCMSTSWLGMTFRRQKEEASNGKANNTPAVDNASADENTARGRPAENGGANRTAQLRGDLQSVEDIYRAAGILNPRMGYSIHKVVEMIHSDHMRGLPSEAKRAAILMALDAASISVEEILRDATQRQEALQTYEAAQKKSFEEYWARKTEGNAQIQAETDRIVAQNLQRIQRNRDEVSREKAEFAKWQSMKHQEAERISEAVGLCSRPPAAEAEAGAALPLNEVVAGPKPS
jgi:hypothetical protein